MATSEHDSDTAALIERTARGDATARQQLLMRYRDRLLRMVALRIDRRLNARVDPSDVVQEALADASLRLDDYIKTRPLPLYPWLRELTAERLSKVHRHHIHTQRRSVAREHQSDRLPLDEESVAELVERLCDRGSSPSGRLNRNEQREQLMAALILLLPQDREILVMRHLEQMEISEIAASLGISEGAVRNRHFRAVLRLRANLGGEP